MTDQDGQAPVEAAPPPGTEHERPHTGRLWFPALDGLRALAALVVVVFHVTGSVAPFTEWAHGDVLIRLGNWGVAIFFVLSGFLLYRPFVSADLDDRPGPAIVPYLTRRLFRIVPAYWVALTFLLVFVRESPPKGGLGTYALFYGFAQNYRRGFVDAGGGLSVAWTLCIEISFYLVLPLLALGLHHLGRGSSTARRVRLQLVAIGVVGLLSLLLRYWVIRERPMATFWLPSYLAWFGAGMALATIHAHIMRGGHTPYVIRLLGRYAGLSWLFGLQVFWLTTLLPVRVPIQTRGELMVIFVCNGLSAVLLLVPVVFGDQSRGPLRGTLAAFPLSWMGEISYGIYLWHTIWLALVVRWVDDGDLGSGAWLRLFVVLVLTLATAQLSYLVIEKPLLQVAHRIGGRRRGPAPSPT